METKYLLMNISPMKRPSLVEVVYSFILVFNIYFLRVLLSTTSQCTLRCFPERTGPVAIAKMSAGFNSLLTLSRPNISLYLIDL